MTMNTKRNFEETATEASSAKKLKKSSENDHNLKKSSKFQKKLKKDDASHLKVHSKESFKKKDNFKGKSFNKNSNNQTVDPNGKPVDWNEFKKKKKEEHKKRKESKNLYDLIVQAKKIGEKLRRKTLKGGDEERSNLTNEIHALVGGQGHYPKLIMTHDMARIVQYQLKFGSPEVRKDIAQELKTVVCEMLQSKYAKYCVKRMLKYGDNETRAAIIKGCYGHAVKLASHAVSAAIFDFGYSNWATPLQKQHLMQEFFGDMYKESKDDSVKHIRDVYAKSPEMKTATLSAVKANLQRILNKTLLDSHLVQTIIMQFLQECNTEDRTELITQLSSHVVVLSNSKEGSRAVMMIIWHGTNKEKKTAIKALKEHGLDLCKHEHGHCTFITAMDALDDTRLISKVLLSDLMKQAFELASDEWGRKVLLWLVAPADTAYFHPTFIKELQEGRENASIKKEADVRRKELLSAIQDTLLKQIADEPKKWMTNNSVAIITLAILKAASGDMLKKAQDELAKLITNINFKIKEGEKEVCGIEHSGLHMILKKIINHDKNATGDKSQFGAAIVNILNENIIEKWVKINRGCFLFVFILESNSEEVQNKLKELLKTHINIIKNNTIGAKILLKKLE